MIIQLYTMQTAEEALACVAAGADHVGLTPPQGLPGELPSLEAMRDIVLAVGDRARCVALTVDMDPARIITLVEVVKPAILHLCPLADAITPETVAALRARLPGIPVMQAVSVTGPESVRVAREYGESSALLPRRAIGPAAAHLPCSDPPALQRVYGSLRGRFTRSTPPTVRRRGRWRTRQPP